MVDFDILEAPVHWASYLVNGDLDSISEEDASAADQHFDGYYVIDCDIETERFTSCADLYGSLSKGDNICEYTVQKV